MAIYGIGKMNKKADYLKFSALFFFNVYLFIMLFFTTMKQWGRHLLNLNVLWKYFILEVYVGKKFFFYFSFIYFSTSKTFWMREDESL